MQFKQLFQRMNLDADVRSLQPGEYRKLTNGITVPPASSSYSNALRGILHSLFRNASIAYSLPSGIKVPGLDYKDEQVPFNYR
jgi:hypothetical protein